MGIFDAMANQAGRSAVDAGMEHFGTPIIKEYAEKAVEKLREEDPWSGDEIEESLKDLLNPDSAAPAGGPDAGSQNEERASIPVTHLRERLVWMSKENQRLKLRKERIEQIGKTMNELEAKRKLEYKKRMQEVKNEKGGMFWKCVKVGAWSVVGTYFVVRIVDYFNSRQPQPQQRKLLAEN